MLLSRHNLRFLSWLDTRCSQLKARIVNEYNNRNKWKVSEKRDLACIIKKHNKKMPYV